MTEFFSLGHKETVSADQNWSQGDFHRLIKLWNAGYVTSRLAMIFGKTQSAISAKLRWARKNGYHLIEHAKKPPLKKLTPSGVYHTEDYDFFSDSLSEIMREGFK